MSFIIPSFEEIRATILRDVKNILPDANVDTDSDAYVRASSVASAIYGLYQHQLWLARQILPDTADTSYLEMHATLRGLTRKEATKATGTITFTGTAGSTIPSSTMVTDESGLLFYTTESVTLESDDSSNESITAVVACEAAIAGAVSDYSDETVTLTAAPSGITATALLTITGGTDTETDAELLARLLFHLQNPSGGGNASDYRNWALEISGVTNAWVYPLRRGIGTVDVAIVSSDGLPTDELVEEVQAYIDEVRPVACKDALVLAPTPLTIDVYVKVRISGSTLPVVTTLIETALESHFADMEPEGLVTRSKIEALISGISYVDDRELVTPSANVQAVVNATSIEWPRLGTVTVEAF